MRTILRRLSVGQWAYLTGSYCALELYFIGEHGRITPALVVFSAAFGLLAAFCFACARPWADRFDIKIKAKVRRLFSRR